MNFVARSNVLKWVAEPDTVYQRYKVDGDMVFVGIGYTLIMGVIDECEVIGLLIEKHDGTDWVEEWRGEFTRFDCTIDTGRCNISVQPRIANFGDAYACTLSRWEREQSMYEVAPIVTVRGTTSEVYEVNPVYCFEIVNSATQPDIDVVCPVPSGWCVEQQSTTNLGGGQWRLQRTYHRETAVGTSLLPPDIGDPDDWTFLTGVIWWRCPDGSQVSVGKFETGRYFNSILEELVSTLDCNITVRSHFFDINNTHASPPSNTQYAYAINYLHTLTIHQKSDVKRPYATPATEKAWGLKLKDVLNDLRVLFNVYFQIVPDGSGGYDMILEHITYFQKQAGPDHTTKPMTLQYEYDADTPARELFRYADEDCSDSFTAKPIVYNCGNGDLEHRMFVFSTDVAYIKNPANQNVIQDTGFVLISTEDAPPNGPATSERVMINGNLPLAWPNLHTYLHKDYRKALSGTMNDTATTFNSVQPLRKQPPYTVGLCPDQTFDPNVYYTTPLGDGVVNEAAYNITQDNIELTLKYE